MTLFVQRSAGNPDSKSVYTPQQLTESQRHIHDIYVEAGIDGESGAIVEAMTTGNKTVLAKAQKKEYARAGLSHILALSGFHLTVLLSFFNLLLFRNQFSSRWRSFTALFLIPVIWIYTAIAGMPVSLVRASVMCSLLQIAILTGSSYNMLNSCALAASVMLIFNPQWILHVGFQLSFACIVGIAVIALPLFRYSATLPLIPSYLLTSVVMSLTCSVFTMPLVAFHFGQIPTYTILSNLIATLLAIPILWGMLLWWMFFWFPAAQEIISVVVLFCAKTMNSISHIISSLPFSSISYRPNLPDVLFLYIFLLLIIRYFYTRNPKTIIAFLSAVILFALLHIVV